jgi:Fe-S cluster biogenesis protein NfuA
LTLTQVAQDEIQRRLTGGGDGEDLAFFVLTQPSPLGFNVGVGFEPRGEDPARPARPEFEVPVQVGDEDWERLIGFTIDYREERFVTMSDVSVHVAETPNPESRKFIVNRDLMTAGSATYNRPSGEDVPPLVRLLLEIPQIRPLFFIQNFCSVTQEPGTNWEEIQSEIGKRLQGYFAHGGAPMTSQARDDADYGEVEKKIIGVLEDVVRPAVQRDGGDIAFAGYEDGVVQLYMLGSCVGCPSALATLKMGVESLLKDEIPEIREVISID